MKSCVKGDFFPAKKVIWLQTERDKERKSVCVYFFDEFRVHCEIDNITLPN